MNLLIRECVRDMRPNMRWAYVAPFRNQAERNAWADVKHYTAGLESLVKYHDSDLRVTFPGGRLLALHGADNADALRGQHFAGVVIDEFAQIDPSVWSEIIRPALAVHRGTAVFLGTPKGRNAFMRLYETAQRDPEWASTLWSVSRTLEHDPEHFPPGELESARRMMLPEEYAQEYECSFEAAMKGAYYAQELAAARATGRIRHVAWDPLLPAVETWWDLGFSDATAVVLTQISGREVRVLDYVEAHHEPLAYYVKQLRERPYLYARHHLPHDAGHKHLAAEGTTLQWQLSQLGLRDTVVHTKQDNVLAGVQQGRLLLGRCVFDAVRCERLLDALATYRAEWDDKRQEARRQPLHDWASHGADAFRLLAMCRVGGAVGQERPVRRVPLPRYAWTA